MNGGHKSSIFRTCFDAVVFGTGFAGYASAMHLKQAGKRVLLVGLRGDILWEAGRAFHPFAGHTDDFFWKSLVQGLEERNGRHLPTSSTTPWFDGALCEVLATDQLMSHGLDMLYYACPAAVERDGNTIKAIIVATKSGYRRIVAGQWIDASESTLLLRLAHPDPSVTLPLRQPTKLAVHLYLQHPDWASAAETADLSDLRTTAWPTERILSFAVSPDQAAQANWRLKALDVLDELAARMGQSIGLVCMSHWSIEPCPEYDATPADSSPDVAEPNLPTNLAIASPAWSHHAIHTLADRWQLGTSAAASLASQSVAAVSDDQFNQPSSNLKLIKPFTRILPLPVQAQAVASQPSPRQKQTRSN